MSSRDVLRILFFDILIENGAIMTSVTLGCKVKAISRILFESPHEPLQGLVEIGGCTGCGVRRKGEVRITVGTTTVGINSIIGASSIWQCDYG